MPGVHHQPIGASDLYIKCGRSSHAGSASALKVGNAMSELHATYKLLVAMCGDSGCGKVSFSPRLSAATAFIYIERLSHLDILT